MYTMIGEAAKAIQESGGKHVGEGRTSYPSLTLTLTHLPPSPSPQS